MIEGLKVTVDGKELVDLCLSRSAWLPEHQEYPSRFEDCLQFVTDELPEE